MKIFLCIFVGLSIFFANIQPVESAFVEGVEDIPLADGLSQIENGTLSFGNEEIRFVEVFCKALNTSFEKIAIFYSETLPQMGWEIEEKTKNRIIFEREGEFLEIVTETSDPLIIRLTVKSRN